jgi:tripartite-type tricarboxylate transporter receptor subunit TctC
MLGGLGNLASSGIAAGLMIETTIDPRPEIMRGDDKKSNYNGVEDIMMTKRRTLFGSCPGRLLASVAILSMAFASCGASQAADFPDHDITFLVPYAPGGGSDQQARRLQPGLQKALGVNIRIVYKTGGGGAVGFSELYRSKPDGYTIANVVVPNIIVSAKGKNVGFKPGDFAYIGMTEQAVGALMLPKNSKFKTLKEFVAFAKANPGKVTVAGVGNTGEEQTNDLTKLLGIKVSYVPVSGGVGKMVPMLLGNHVDAGVTSSSHAVKHKSELITLVTAGGSPSKSLPGAPNEAGWTMATTWGVMAPPGTPAAVVAKLNAALNKATVPVKDLLEKNGLTPMRQTPEEAKKFIQNAIANN